MASTSNPVPTPGPNLNIPKSDATCTVKIVDTTCEIVTPPNYLIEPEIEGMQWLNLPDYAFHIKHNGTGQELLFDLGTRYDWENSPPHIVDLLKSAIPGFRVKKDCTDVLKDGGVDLGKVKAFILSHWHFDHSGNIQKLPPSVDLVVGPGFKDEFLPGHPSKEGSPFWEDDFKGRNVIEAPFSDQKIGKFQSWDYFGDGSVYVLNTPGHATGHVSALIRTTPDTLIFMGGDLCHFTGDIRPTEWIPLPDPLPAQAQLDKRIPQPCPASTFTKCHPNQDDPQRTAFFKCSSGPNSFYHDPPLAMESIRNLMEFDADPNVLVIIAHDTAPAELMPFFPEHNINDWKAKGWKESMHWHFLNELPIDGKQGREPLLDGLYMSGKKVKDLHGNAV